MEYSMDFLKMTAMDYDMQLHNVERIARLWPDEFYAKLEEWIKERS